MGQKFCADAVVPPGFALEECITTDDGMELVVRGRDRASACPNCGSRSVRVHSRYRRRLGDLPLAGRPVRLVLMARRFRCDAAGCACRMSVGV